MKCSNAFNAAYSMVLSMTYATAILSSATALSAENSRFYDCTSKNGNVRLVIGTSGEEPVQSSTAELTIDEKSSGPMEIGTDIEGSSGGATTRYTLTSTGANWLTIEQRPTTDAEKKKGLLKMSINSGIDPRTNKTISAPISLTCHVVTTAE